MTYIEKARKEVRKVLSEYLKYEAASGTEYQVLLDIINVLDGHEGNTVLNKGDINAK